MEYSLQLDWLVNKASCHLLTQVGAVHHGSDVKQEIRTKRFDTSIMQTQTSYSLAGQLRF